MEKKSALKKLNNDLRENEPRGEIVVDTSQIYDTCQTNKYKRTSKMYRLEKFENCESDFVKAKRAICNRAKKFADKVKRRGFLVNYLKQRLPFMDWLPKYNLKTYLIADILAGFTVGKLT